MRMIGTNRFLNENEFFSEYMELSILTKSECVMKVSEGVQFSRNKD